MNGEQIAGRLHGRKSGDGWIARCPAHEDRSPSMSLREVSGKVLVHCHAGCEQRDVVNALESRELWPRSRARNSGSIVATYDYTDETGQLLYQVVRREPKSFQQRRPDGLGGWIWKKNERQVLYRLIDVIGASIVFVVEGEKDVESLRAHGFVATTNAGGAEAPWLPAFTEALRGREVILIPDNDAPGNKRALRIARALLGQVARLKFLPLPGAKDATDWFARGHSELELISLVERVPRGH